MIHLDQFGSANDVPPLVAVPGIDGSIGSVEPIVDALSQSRTVFVVDYTLENNATLEDLTREAASVIETEIDGPVDVLGQSIGSIVAAQLAAYPALPIRRVVLMCTFTRLNDLPLRLSYYAMKMVPSWLYHATAPFTMAVVCGPVGNGRDHPFFEASRESDKDRVAKRTAWQIGRDFSGVIRSISQPLLVLMGEDDRFVPDPQVEITTLRRLLADRSARVVPIPNAGHVFLDSRAIDRALDNITPFLDHDRS